MQWHGENLDHTYEPDKTFGEEASFTNQFTESMIQLHPIHTVITSCHNLNTFDKTNVLQSNYFTKLPDSLLEKIIPLDQFNIYKEICNHL